MLLTVETELFRFRYRNIALFVESCNSVLERELSAYRLIGGKFVQITDEAEIRTLDEALHTPIQQVKRPFGGLSLIAG
ncbi:MAG: hypothetical protein M5R40_00445 [Anaerolineae bacterium]|nr:hypothetical protein [Anaerolineae bacterium]